MPSCPVLFRADAGPGIGSGHAMRCLALAQALMDAGTACHLLIRTYEAQVIDRWEREGCIVHHRPELAGAADGVDTGRVARELGAEWVVTDGYALGLPFQRAVREQGLRLLCFDDLADAPIEADIIVNQNPGAEVRAHYACPPETEILRGCDFVMLRRELRATHHIPRGGPLRLLVTFGGDDRDNLALEAMRLLETEEAAFEATVICSANEAGFTAALQMAATRLDRWRVLRPTPEIARLMGQTDLALCAGGTTALELASLGIPSVILPLAANQVPGARSLGERECALVAEPHALPEAVAHLRTLLGDADRRHAMARRATELVDGRGPERLRFRLSQPIEKLESRGNA